METSVNQVTLSHPPGELTPCTENCTVGRMGGMFERINKMIEQQTGVPSCIPAEACGDEICRITGIDGRITAFSPGAESMLGYSADEIVLGDLVTFHAQEVVAKHMLKEDTKYFPLLKDVLKPQRSGTTSEPRAQ